MTNNMMRKVRFAMTIAATAFAMAVFTACASTGDNDGAVQPKEVVATKAVVTTTAAQTEAKTTTTTEAITTSEPETTPTDETKHEIATTPVETMPENSELLPVEECLKKLIAENVGEEVTITNIECNEIEGDMIIYLDNGMEIGTTNVASHYVAGDKTSLDNYEIDKDTFYDYFILYWG